MSASAQSCDSSPQPPDPSVPGQPRLFLAEEVDQFSASQPEEARRRLGRLVASMDRDGDGGLAVAELAAWIHTVHKVGPVA